MAITSASTRPIGSGGGFVSLHRRQPLVGTFALGLLLALAVSPAGAAPKSWNDADDVREMFFAWCIDEGWREPSRSADEMAARSPQCAADSVRRVELYRQAASKGPLILQACKESKASRPVPLSGSGGIDEAGACLEYPRLLAEAPFSVVEPLRRALSDGEDPKAIEAWLQQRLPVMAGAELRDRLAVAGLTCSAGKPDCGITLGILLWGSSAGQVRTGRLCSVTVRIGVSATAPEPAAVHVMAFCP